MRGLQSCYKVFARGVFADVLNTRHSIQYSLTLFCSHPILFERIQDNDATLIEARQSSTAQRPYRDEDQDNHQQHNDDYDGPDNSALLQSQQQQMARQDDQLDVLGQSIGRQHHLSLQMNEELATHAELLDEMDRDVDSTTARLGRASRNLDKFTKSLKEHGENQRC